MSNIREAVALCLDEQPEAAADFPVFVGIQRLLV
jgi:hypothetical protein